jgi:hypothetical protein
MAAYIEALYPWYELREQKWVSFISRMFWENMPTDPKMISFVWIHSVSRFWKKDLTKSHSPGFSIPSDLFNPMFRIEGVTLAVLALSTAFVHLTIRRSSTVCTFSISSEADTWQTIVERREYCAVVSKLSFITSPCLDFAGSEHHDPASW